MDQTVSSNNIDSQLTESPQVKGFPYSFAKRNGVVLQRSNEGKLIVH